MFGVALYYLRVVGAANQLVKVIVAAFTLAARFKLMRSLSGISLSNQVHYI